MTVRTPLPTERVRLTEENGYHRRLPEIQCISGLSISNADVKEGMKTG